MRTEQVELTVLCLLHKDDCYLLQNRTGADWSGYALPGGHIEPGESIVEAIIREMKEETGLIVKHPRLCGVKQFPTSVGRYVVFLFEATEFEGELASSEEGEMRWISAAELPSLKTVDDFSDLLDVMLNENLTEFQYVIEDGKWIVRKH